MWAFKWALIAQWQGTEFKIILEYKHDGHIGFPDYRNEGENGV